jgi:uncharacterized protein HemY
MTTLEKTDVSKLRAELDEAKKNYAEKDKIIKNLEKEDALNKDHIRILQRELEGHVLGYKRRLDDMCDMRDKAEHRLRVVKKKLKEALSQTENSANS